MAKVVLGLGSNIGNRRVHLREAKNRLARLLMDICESHLMETAAILPEGAPAEWNLPYLNMAVCGDTELPPRALLQQLKNIERQVGRVERGRWAPREIDIDILAIDEMVMHTPMLTIPHGDLINRDFALLPLAELLPGWRYPVTGRYQNQTAEELAVVRGFHKHKRKILADAA